MRSFLFLAVLFSVAVFRINAQADCKGSIGSSSYDLSGLAKAIGSNDVTTTDQAGNLYYFRPCNAVTQAGCGQGTNPPNPATCQKDTRIVPKFHSCGSTGSVTWKPRTTGGDAGGFILHFINGEEDRQSDVEFICDPQGGTGTLTAATPTEQPTHFYHLQWTSSLVCPGHSDGGGDGGGDDGGGISGGWIFIIILLGLFVLYLIGGVIYKRVRTEDRGLDMIPNKDFWFGLPMMVVSGHIYLWRKARGLCGAQYETV